MTTTAAARPRRKKRAPGWVPNQHGAWAMLATPLLVGIIASGPAWTHLPLAAFWFLGYFAFFATGLWLKSRRKVRYRNPVIVYGAAAATTGALTLAAQPELIRWAPIFVLPLGVGLAASATRHERSLWSGVTMTIGSSLMTVIAYDAGGGTDFARAWLLAGILAAYFIGTVVYVKTLIRERGKASYYWLSVGFHAAATLALVWLCLPLAAVFAALTARAAVLPSFRISPKQAGIGEILATVVVAVVALMST